MQIQSRLLRGDGYERETAMGERSRYVPRAGEVGIPAAVRSIGVDGGRDF